jgi:hypothetical protein
MPQDFKWEYGEPHHAMSGDTAFLELVHRVTFLGYKVLLRTTFLHEDADCVNLFSLLVETLQAARTAARARRGRGRIADLRGTDQYGR